MGKACNLSDELNAILRAHHRPSLVDEQFWPLLSTVSLALNVAHRVGELQEESPWSSETSFTEALKDAQVTQYLAEQVGISTEKLAATVFNITGDAQDFVQDVVNGVTLG